MLVAITGVDCAGKTTQISRLKELFSKNGIQIYTVALVNKPTVRNLTNSALQKDPHPISFPFEYSSDHFAMAYNIDFYNHYIDNISKYIQSNSEEIIISDRFSTCYKAFAYAIGAQNDISYNFLNDIIPAPNIEICFDLNINIVLKRIEERKEMRSLDETYYILKKLIAYYRDYASNNTNVVMINADQPIDKITKILYDIIEKHRNREKQKIF